MMMIGKGAAEGVMVLVCIDEEERREHLLQ
jgi:hypothetical protein